MWKELTSALGHFPMHTDDQGKERQSAQTQLSRSFFPVRAFLFFLLGLLTYAGA